MEKSQEFVRPFYLNLKYTEYDPLQLYVLQKKKEIHLMTYRYAVPQNIRRKGVVFFLTFYGWHFEHQAYLLKEFAENGYECFALDLRGFGNSEGIRTKIGKSQALYGDMHSFVQKALALYSIDPKVTPLFLYGVSFGGITCFNFSIKSEVSFRAMALIVPFFKSPGKALEKLQPLFKTITFFSPNFTIKGKKDKIKDISEYPLIYNDPKLITSVAISTVILIKEMQDFATANVKEAKTPFLMITAFNDTMVDNSGSYELFKKSGNSKNKHIEFEDEDHLSIVLEKQNLDRVVKEAISYFDSLIG